MSFRHFFLSSRRTPRARVPNQLEDRSQYIYPPPHPTSCHANMALQYYPFAPPPPGGIPPLAAGADECALALQALGVTASVGSFLSRFFKLAAVPTNQQMATKVYWDGILGGGPGGIPASFFDFGAAAFVGTSAANNAAKSVLSNGPRVCSAPGHTVNSESPFECTRYLRLISDHRSRTLAGAGLFLTDLEIVVPQAGYVAPPGIPPPVPMHNMGTRLLTAAVRQVLESGRDGHVNLMPLSGPMSARMGAESLAQTWARRNVLRFPALFGANASNFSLVGITGAAIPATLVQAFPPGTFVPFGYQPPVVPPAAGPGGAPVAGPGAAAALAAGPGGAPAAGPGAALPAPPAAPVAAQAPAGGAAALGVPPPAPPPIHGLMAIWLPGPNMWAYVPAPAAAAPAAAPVAIPAVVAPVPAPAPAPAVPAAPAAPAPAAAAVPIPAPAPALPAAAGPAVPVGAPAAAAPVIAAAIQYQPNKASIDVINVQIALTPQEAARAVALAAQDDDGRDTPSVYVKTLKSKMESVRSVSQLVQAISRLENLLPRVDAAHPGDVYGPGVSYHQEVSTLNHTQRAAGIAGAPKPWLQAPLEYLDFLMDCYPSLKVLFEAIRERLTKLEKTQALQRKITSGISEEDQRILMLLHMAQSPVRNPTQAQPPAIKRPAPDGQRQQPRPAFGGAPPNAHGGIRPGQGPAPFPGFNALPVPAMFGGAAPMRQPAGFANPPNPAYGQLVNAVHIRHPALDYAACKRKVAGIVGRRCAACGNARVGASCPTPGCTSQVAKAEFLNKANNC